MRKILPTQHRLLILLLTVVLLAKVGTAQDNPFFTYITDDQVDTASTQIAVKITNPSITKIRFTNETNGNSLVKNVSVKKSFLMTVELDEGDNSFNITAYDKDKIVRSTDKPIVIVRKKLLATAHTSPTVLVTRVGSPSRTNQDQKLRLLGKGVIKNQATYTFEIDASTMPPQIGNYAIDVANENKKGKTINDSETRKIEIDAGSNRHKPLQSVEIKLREGINTIRVFPRVDGVDLFDSRDVLIVECTNCKDQPKPSESVVVRSIVGLEQVGASSARSQQSPFVSFFFNTPVNIGTKKDCPTGIEPKDCTTDKKVDKAKFAFSVWGDVRFTTTPVQSIGSLANFTPAGFASNFVQGDSAGKVNDLVRSFDFLVGFDKELVGPGEVFEGIFPGKTSLSFIAAGGAISPLSSDDQGAVFYKIPVDIETDANAKAFFDAFPGARNKTNIAFVAPERDRLFRQYYAGFRLKTFFSDKETRFVPAMFDVTFGQNEAITGRLKGVIMRLDGSMPFPVAKAGFLYLFGSVNMRLGRSKEIIPPFFLEPVTNISLSSADTFVTSINDSPFNTRDRDIFRIGVGVDLLRLFKKDETPK